MTPEYIKEQLKNANIFRMRHRNGGYYFMDTLIQIHINDEWVNGATYHSIGPYVRYCRPLTEFTNFTHMEPR